jgi:hypothetical protein
MDQNTIERIAGIEMQIKLFKWALGGFCILMMVVSGGLVKWIYAQGSDVNVLKNDLKTQKLVIETHEKKIDKSASHSEKMGKHILANTIHLENIKEMIGEVKTILKGKNGSRGSN